MPWVALGKGFAECFSALAECQAAGSGNRFFYYLDDISWWWEVLDFIIIIILNKNFPFFLSLRRTVCISHCMACPSLYGRQYKRLSLPGASCGEGFGYLRTSPEGRRATTWRLKLTTSHHLTLRTTNAEATLGAVGRWLRWLLSGEETMLLALVIWCEATHSRKAYID
jgi:hypothetical protein